MGGAPQDPDDFGRPQPGSRAWIHPSELPGAPPPPTPPRPRRSRIVVPVTAGLAGAVAALGVTALVSGWIGTGTRGAGPVGVTASSALASAALGDVLGGSRTGPATHDAVAAGVVRATAWVGAIARHGSAVAVGDGGLLVSTASLVEAADAVEVAVPGGPATRATVVGVDPEYDLALLRADGLDTRALEPVDDERRPEVGDPCVVVAGGSSTHEGHVAARGVIASWGRVMPAEHGWLVDVIEVDVTPDASATGGALLDGSGALVGIVTTPGGTGAMTVAVPVAHVDRSVTQILAAGSVAYPWLGVAASDVGHPRGARVEIVSSEGPAQDSRLEVGDVIVALDDEPVEGMATLMRLVRRHAVGDAISLEVDRGGARLTVTIRLAARPDRVAEAATEGSDAG